MALDGARRGDHGGTLLIEGPAGVGKTALLGELSERAAADGYRVLRARGSEMERDFGFGLVRQLLGPLLRSLGPEGRAKLFAGPAGLAAAIFGLAGGGLEVGAAESSLYGLFWMVVTLAEARPIVLVVDDAHWGDAASLRFARYLGQRLEGLPVLLVVAARPGEPGVQGEALRRLAADFAMPTIRPAPLSEAGTAAIVRDRLGAPPREIEAACHEATGGNPFLIEELLTELTSSRGPSPAVKPEDIAAMGPERIAAEAIERSRRLDLRGPEVMRAIAVLGDGADLRAVAGLAEVDLAATGSIVDGLSATGILVDAGGHGFAHPLLRGAVYQDIPQARRAALHASAARLLAAPAGEPDDIAAHVLRCEPGMVPGAIEILDAAAARATDRGAPDSARTYLVRALEEQSEPAPHAELLHRLGSAEVTLRDPASIEHLRQAAESTAEPRAALEIFLELLDVLAIAGLWEETVATVDAALARFGQTELPGVLDLEALGAAFRAYDSARAAEFDRDLPRLRALVAGRTDEDSRQLRWLLAAVGATRDASSAEVLELVGPADQDWTLRRRDREISFVGHAMFALLPIDADAEVERIVRALTEDGRERGSLLSIVSGLGCAAALHAHRGRLGASEADIDVAMELIRENDLSLMPLTTFINFSLDTVVERRGLDEIAAVVENLELPPQFGDTVSGGLVAEVRAAVRMARGDRRRAVADLREAERIFVALKAGPRLTHWRSRLALALPEEARAEAIELAGAELELARGIDSRREEAIALRALGALRGGESGIELLGESVAILRDGPSPLELARSLAELGAALRRGNQRAEARELLREAADLAQRCGAERLEERIDDELRVAGARPRRRAVSGSGSLTPGELRVAAAAAGGASNREIAQDLFVSLRTVEMHLTNTYRKLDISSRSELAGAIDE